MNDIHGIHWADFKTCNYLTRTSFDHCYINQQPCYEAKAMSNPPPAPETGSMDLCQFFWQLGSL